MRFEEWCLERQQLQYKVEIARHRARAIGAHRPDLWRDVIDRADRWICTLQGASDAMGEVGAVDHDDGVGACLKREIASLPHASEDLWNFGNDFAQPHY